MWRPGDALESLNFADFIRLPFLIEKGGQSLEQSIDLVRKLDQQAITKIPNDMDTKFMDSQLTIAMRDKNGEIKRNLWEMGLAVAIKDGFRSGDLYVEHSNKYASFWNLIYQDCEWQQEKENSYQGAQEIKRKIEKLNNIQILGPVDSPIFKKKKMFRTRLLIRSESNIICQKPLAKILENLKISSKIKLTVDVDPINFT